MFIKDKKYKWEFINLGGSSRIKIRNGEDIAHLDELDHKMWTVLSCPVKGLEINDKSLAYMDTDGDGKIHVDDVVKTAKWITSLLKNNDLILEGTDSIELSAINTEIEAGQKLYKSAKQIVENLGKTEEKISLADTADCAAIFAQTKYNGDGVITEASADTDEQKAAIAAAVATVGGVADRSGAAGVDAGAIEAFYKALADYVAWTEAEVAAPFADKTDATIAAYNALDAKVKDFFMRSKLAAFTPDSAGSLDVQTSSIASISGDNLTGKLDEIASYPLAKCVEVDEVITNHENIMAVYDPKGEIDLLLDEWGTWFDVEPGTNPGHLYQQNTMRDAMVAALSLNIFHNHAERLKMANIAQIVNVLQSMILTKGNEIVLTPTYHVFRMYNVHQDATYIPLEYKAAEFTSPSGRPMPEISLTASRDSKGNINVSIVNPMVDKAQTVTLTFDELKPEKITGEILKSKTVNDYNDFGKAPAVAPAPFTGYKAKKDQLTVTIPAASIVSLTL